MVKDLALVFFLITFTTVRATAAAGSDPIFTEGGGAVPYALEEEILEELAKGQETKGESKNEEKDFVGVSSAGKTSSKSEDVKDQQQARPQQADSAPPSNRPAPAAGGIGGTSNNPKQQYDELKSAAAAAIMKQTSILQEQQQQKPMKQKKEGQEEFATFVDPFSQPAQNRRLQADKMNYGGYVGHEAKRAQIDATRSDESGDLGDTVFIAVVAVCSVVGFLGFTAAGYTFYSMHKQYKAAQDVEYPHYGVTGPAKERTSGSASPVAVMDAKLASSAQLYHYQHTKQQIIAMEHFFSSTSDAKGQESEDSEGEGDEGDFSVYECPGLAPTGDIEVSNPLFENVASPQAKTDPRHQQQGNVGGEQSPRVHQRSPVRGEDP